jgi:hypothetical protein
MPGCWGLPNHLDQFYEYFPVQRNVSSRKLAPKPKLMLLGAKG